MGIGMQIVYLGFCGTARLEGEAAAQLVRLEPYSGLLSNCHLAIEEIHSPSARPTYDVRLDLITRARDLKPIEHYSSEDAEQAVRWAFDAAEKELQATEGAARLRRQ
ncbi:MULTISPECIES: hypothetical protein [Paraburkholderia]|jgi:hypothetical protein|uniref:hypothetical protein n=1 Tax=Paraburkholderia TaxID=1822464 RepID=UPI0006D43332|nr:MULTISPECIES: hypothetical protein [Paraburkholderia]ALP67109.1 hypothetical protein AN416_30865 [Paraburkholderia caribensis]AMV47686.1 hypothetical protein ATN79_44250 [Paraburkholderia caribensis]AUT56815.1 hypothetical protein C2L66_33820 [Paraburkholderia caribensis]CAG9239537.1 conserved hypothetical protein [Paraburkholderia caribensis]